MTDKIKDPALRKCPFCKKAPIFQIGLNTFTDVVVTCMTCLFDGPVYDIENNDPEKAEKLLDEQRIQQNKIDCAKHWNMRDGVKEKAPK